MYLSDNHFRLLFPSTSGQHEESPGAGQKDHGVWAGDWQRPMADPTGCRDLNTSCSSYSSPAANSINGPRCSVTLDLACLVGARRGRETGEIRRGGLSNTPGMSRVD